MTKVARDLMQAEPLTVPQDMAYLRLLHLFVEAGINSAPVVDARGGVVGIVSIQELMRVVDQACDDELDAGESHRRRDLGATLRSRKAGDLASADVLWVEEDTPVDQIAASMRRCGSHRALVGRAGKLAGLLTTFDMLIALEHR